MLHDETVSMALTSLDLNCSFHSLPASYLRSAEVCAIIPADACDAHFAAASTGVSSPPDEDLMLGGVATMETSMQNVL